jgi:hypothetical protein
MKYYKIRIVVEGNSIYTAALTQPFKDDDCWTLQNILQDQPRGCSTIGEIDWSLVSAIVWSIEDFEAEVKVDTLKRTYGKARRR